LMNGKQSKKRKESEEERKVREVIEVFDYEDMSSDNLADQYFQNMSRLYLMDELERLGITNDKKRKRSRKKSTGSM